ncbi:NAD-dependent epimerase/dehydratase family protein [Amycolatopsis keratiniphila]|uniref:NAD-dependent epimerase/dehydratase family protein n=1 Tax=Amycolatopsis keratiniphila TaxID=129921 RepID=UPI00087A0071|nr:NAD-dependent epimerase/dehydratase family protein [Amycolatopsis keratiniphila]OLZ57763.1 nucleoside-diphosphate sugar epimerase [Amycolatopsis keratiniphila subsp. nogabecina]SDU02308.1 Nucleoside-diphosphate-sugar epimerase [Amycolatopsis keratiniphila]
MRIVVTGASGNIGTALLRVLSGEGHDVIGVARHRPDTTVAPYSSARWVQQDVGANDAWEELTGLFRGADAVVHLAWAIHPRADDPAMRRTNMAGSANVLRAAADAGVEHIVCASSVAAYTPADRWHEVDEDWPCGGLAESAYSVGKAAFETQLDEFCRRYPDIGVARIRPCGVVQPDAAAEFSGWLLSPLAPPLPLGGDWLPVPLWPGLRMQVVHADDVARAIRAILDRRATGAFNLAGEPVLKSRDLARLTGGIRIPVPLKLLTSLAWPSWRLGLQPLHPSWLRLADRASLVDTRRAREELGWRPRHDPAATITELLAAIRAGRRGGSRPLDPPRDRIRLGRPSHQDQSAGQ